MLALREQPNQFIPENQKDQKWFLGNLRYIAEKYNTQQNQLGYRHVNTLQKPIEEMIRMFTYYLGKQENKDYYYTNQDENNCELPTVWINGQKLTSMIDFMIGNAIKMIENIEPSVRGTSKAIVSRKSKKLEYALMKMELQELVEIMSAKGVEFNPVGMETFQNKEELFRHMKYDYKEQAEVVAQRLAEDILHRNHYIEKYKQSFLYLLLGGVCGIENTIQNGKQKKDVILPYNLIWDNSIDDDFNTKAHFVGKIEWKTPGEILSNPTYMETLTAEEVDEIMKLTHQNIDKMLGEEYITSTKLRWWYNYSGVPKIACITGYWIGYKELRYEKTKDQFGNEHFAKIRTKHNSKYWTKTVYKGTIIANKYVVEYGEQTNIVRKADEMAEVELPISVFLPNMVMGETRSIASRLHKHQDRIDFLNNEITKMITRAKGKVFIMNKHKLGSATSQEVLNDFTRMGIHITDGNATGEDFNQSDYNKVVEIVDMTLDPNVQMIMSLRQEEERIMEEIVNVPKVAMGQQQGYLGAKTQAGSIAQSNLGTAYLYQGFIQFIEKDLQFALNQYKISLLSNNEPEIGVLGDKEMEFIKVTDNFKFEDFGVYIKIKDFVDEQARERLLAIAQAAMQNQMIDLRDYIKIETSKTYTELLNELEYSLEKKDREKKEAEAKAQIMQAAMQEAQMAQQQKAVETAQQGNNYRQELKTASDLVKSNPDTQDAAAMGGGAPEQGGEVPQGQPIEQTGAMPAQ